MKLFIDTAKLDEIKQAYSLGILDGITTNPSLMKKAVDSMKPKMDLESYINAILELAKGTPVSLEVTRSDYEGMVSEGLTLYKKFNPVAKNVYIKIPVNPSMKKNESWQDGIRAIKTLSKKGIPINCTLIFTPEQALLAAKAGAKFVSPFAGRIDDFIREKNRIKFNKTDYFPEEGYEKSNKLLEDNGINSGVDLIHECVKIFNTYKIKSEVLAASIRNSRQLREVALAGAHIATVPFSVIKESLAHEKTLEGMKSFTRDIVPEYAKLAK